jgi:hypothetical protein
VIRFKNCFRHIRIKVKTKDMQTTIKNKYETDDGPGKTYRDFSGVVSKRTINWWIKMINDIDSIDLLRSTA